MNLNRSHLVPTTVTNRNGVQTTVYKKPAASSGSAMLPQATLPTARTNRKKLEHETAETLITESYGPVSSPDSFTSAESVRRKREYAELFDALSRYSENTLQRITEAATTDINWHLLTLIKNQQPDEAYLNDWITIRSHVHDNTVNDDLTINGLETYRLLAPQDNGQYPDERTRAVNAIVRLTIHFGAIGDGLLFSTNESQQMLVTIDNEGLRDLISTHHDPDGIADIIIARNLMDPEQLTAVYEAVRSTPSAISEGTL